MDALIEEVYRLAPDVDEGEAVHREEYAALARRRDELGRRLSGLLSGDAAPLFDAYAAVRAQEQDLTARHFFREGFCAGQQFKP